MIEPPSLKSEGERNVTGPPSLKSEQDLEFNYNILVFFIWETHLLGFSARQGLENSGVVRPLERKL